MIRMHITSTGKGYSKNDSWRIFDEQTKTFQDMAAAKEYLKENYGKAKRSPMYIDTKEGTKKCGYIVGFRNAGLSHYPVEKWIQQDWITFADENPIYLN